MGYKAVRNCSKFRDRVVKNDLANEFGEYVYDQMYEATELIGNQLTKENDKLKECLAFYAKGGNFNMDIWFDEKLGYFTGKKAKELLEEIEQ